MKTLVQMDEVIELILAHSAASAVMGNAGPGGPLHSDHRRMLECLAREAFCRACIILAPALQEADPQAFTLTFAAHEPAGAARHLAWLIAALALNTLMASAGDEDMAALYERTAREGLEHLWRMAGGAGAPPALRPAWY